jgi:hypothetical protein
VIGGFASGERLRTVVRLHLATNELSSALSLGEARSGSAACIVGDRIFLTGGLSQRAPLDTVSCFRPRHIRVGRMRPMTISRSADARVAFDGYLFVVAARTTWTRRSTAWKGDSS